MRSRDVGYLAFNSLAEHFGRINILRQFQPYKHTAFRSDQLCTFGKILLRQIAHKSELVFIKITVMLNSRRQTALGQIARDHVLCQIRRMHIRTLLSQNKFLNYSGIRISRADAHAGRYCF